MAQIPNTSTVSGDIGQTLRRSHVDAFLTHRVAAWPSGQLVLDLGGHRESKRGHFDLTRYPHQVIHVNLVTAKRPDVQADAHALPFPSALFDAVLCTELLEHVYRPELVIREIFRVTKEGGSLLITAPFLTPVHGDPDDFARFTAHYWEKSLDAAGFIEVQIIQHGYFWSVLLDLLRSYALDGGSANETWRSKLGRRIVKLLVLWGRRRLTRAEAREQLAESLFQKRFTTGFGVQARKPSDDSV